MKKSVLDYRRRVIKARHPSHPVTHQPKIKKKEASPPG